MTRVWLLGGLVTGCAVPAYPDAVEDDTAAVVDSAVETDVPEDTDETVTIPRDTGWVEDDVDTDVLGGGPTGTPIGCHPYDPVVTAAGWVRRYDVTYGRDRGNETHTGRGLLTLPTWAAGTQTDAFAYDVSVTQAGSANNTGRVYQRCDLSGPGAFELAWERQIQAGLLGRTTITLRAKARTPRKFLPSEAEMAGAPNWAGVTRYDLTQVGGTIGGSAQAQLNHDGTYVSFGFEPVTTAAGTFQQAFHINVQYTETKTGSGGGFLDAFFSIFESLFAAMFGFTDGSSTVTAQSDRWYVRGIGLVKEETINFNDGSNIVTKSLKGCSGLPSCP